MSHFTVTVLTPERPSYDELAKILQPWHEYECTGVEDEYVVEVDKTSEALERYAKATEERLKGPDGVLHDRFDANGQWKPEFSRAAPERFDPNRRVGIVPSGYELVDVPASTVVSAAEWISGYYGWPVSGRDDGTRVKYGWIDLRADGSVERCVDRTNPNAKWDWWAVGGRWTGYLKLKRTAVFHSLGRPGTFHLVGPNPEPLPGEGRADQAMLKDVDVEGMRAEAADKARGRWTFATRLMEGLDRSAFRPWSSFVEEFERTDGAKIDDYRGAYHAQPIARAFKGPEVYEIIGFANPETFFGEPADYLQAARDSALQTFAVVKDGRWYERGKMGWFGITHGKKEGDVWGREFAKLIDGLLPTTWLTIVDCHI